MGTKLRSFSMSKITGVTAFILAVAIITAFSAMVQNLYYEDIQLESLIVKEYKYSRAFRNQVETALSKALKTLETKVDVKEIVPYYYYISDTKKAWTNSDNTAKNFFEQFTGAYYAYENGNPIWGPETNPEPIIGLNRYAGVKVYNTIYLAFPDDYMETKQLEWEQSRSNNMPYAIAVIISMALLLLLIIYLIAVTGRVQGDRELHLYKRDRIYSDILVAALFAILLLWFMSVKDLLYTVERLPNEQYILGMILTVLISALTAITATVCGMIMLSLVRKLKAGKLISSSLIYVSLHWVYDNLRSIFDGRAFKKYPLTKSLFFRQLIFISASFIFVCLTFLFLVLESYIIILPPVLEIIMIFWYVKGNNKTYEEINKGFNDSLEEQMKSERMKVALITNVSHDLKTPLTSIISYVDLLSKEENLSDSARDYVKILSEKSTRLKNMVSDLFDLSKSASGNMPVDIENIDLKKLIEQTLADMEDKVEKSELVMRVKLPDKPVNVFADGKKLYRVLQNVIDNALKYSYQGTRVYIELVEVGGTAEVTIKNTAGYEMDFTVEEILQRFSRGDTSRTTEGSGLGLSIAESFTNVCGGDFKIDIDGDLFKVVIRFKTPGILPHQ